MPKLRIKSKYKVSKKNEFLAFTKQKSLTKNFSLGFHCVTCLLTWFHHVTISCDSWWYINHMQYTGIMELNMEHVFSVDTIVYGYYEYQNAWDTPIGEILSCGREAGNIHDTFAVASKKDGEGSHPLRLSLFHQFQTSKLVIKLCMDPYCEHHRMKALNSVVCLCMLWQRKSLTMGFLNSILH